MIDIGCGDANGGCNEGKNGGVCGNGESCDSGGEWWVS